MKKLILIAIVIVGCKNKVGEIDLSGTVYKYNSDGTYNSFQVGTYIFTVFLMISAYYIGTLKHKDRNTISPDESFLMFACAFFIAVYVIILPLLVIFI